jgi:mono/diheme cytochrome c family protein
VAPTVSPQDIERVRDQLRTELMAELQRQQAARPPQAAAPVQAADQPRLRASDEASLRQILSASGYDRTNLPAMISAGGRLFDHLFAAQGKAAPTSAHPAWPQGRQAASAGETWRCSSCHGFDYQGDPGTARLGGGGVPFRSVRRAERMSPEQVVALLGAAPHNYSDDFLPRSAKIELAMFLVKGQYTASRYFGSDGKAKGVAARGKDRYVTACASCHGFDGRLGVKPNAASLGAIAKDSPAEMFHKIRNGHPGAINAAMRPTPLGAQTDLLAYVQTLPR